MDYSDLSLSPLLFLCHQNRAKSNISVSEKSGIRGFIIVFITAYRKFLPYSPQSWKPAERKKGRIHELFTVSANLPARFLPGLGKDFIFTLIM